MMYNTYYCKSDLEHIQKTDKVHGQYAIDLGQITCPIANRPWSEPRSRSICPNNPGLKKMGRTYLSKIPTISSNPHTIMLLLIVGEFEYLEVAPSINILVLCQPSRERLELLKSPNRSQKQIWMTMKARQTAHLQTTGQNSFCSWGLELPQAIIAI
jgi:hypothetical protein